MAPLLAAAERVPNWVRGVFAIVLPVLAFTTAAFRSPVTVAFFLAWTALTLWLHAPVFAFDGPLPFSDVGVHVSGDVHRWDEVVRVEPLGERDLQAVLRSGATVRLRVKGRRTRDELRSALARHRPQLIAF